MDELRNKRYRDKIQHIFDYIQELPIEPKNELEKRGIFSLFIHPLKLWSI